MERGLNGCHSDMAQYTSRSCKVREWGNRRNTFSQQEDVISKLVSLWLRLQQGHEDGGLLQMHKILQAFDNEVGG